ncbi:hypothetical protein B0H14DRAFT_3623648 [Mycena olivaceomarginata]|nr:hypothetical protein B0H14DRAFT_3623648 [Mycena olivaceomarginata]
MPRSARFGRPPLARRPASIDGAPLPLQTGQSFVPIPIYTFAPSSTTRVLFASGPPTGSVAYPPLLGPNTVELVLRWHHHVAHKTLYLPHRLINYLSIPAPARSLPMPLPSCSFPTLALTGRALSLGDRHSCSLPPPLRSLPSPSRSMPPALALVAPRPRARCPPPSCSMPAALAFDTCLPRRRKPTALALDARISRAFPPPSRLMPPALAVLVLASLRPRIRFPPLLCLLPAALELITRRPRPLALVTRQPRPLALVTRRPRPLPCPRPAHDCHPIRARCPPLSRSLLAARVPFRACARWPPPACSVLDPRPMRPSSARPDASAVLPDVTSVTLLGFHHD